MRCGRVTQPTTEKTLLLLPPAQSPRGFLSPMIAFALHTAAMAHYDMLPGQPYAHEQAEVRGDSARRRVPRARPVSYREGCAGAQEAHRSCGGVGKGLSRRGRHRGIRSPAGL